MTAEVVLSSKNLQVKWDIIRVIRCTSGMANCLPHEAASRVSWRCACILIGLICSPIGRCRLIKKFPKSDDYLAGRSIICPADFSSQVQGRKRAGGREELSRSLKRKLSVSAERRNSYPHSGDIPSWWVLFQRGRHQSMKHTSRDRQQRAGEPCTSNSYGVAFSTTLRKK